MSAPHPVYPQSGAPYSNGQRASTPTPSELEDMDERPFSFKTLMSRGQSKGTSTWGTIAMVAFAIIFIVILALHSKIVDAIDPAAEHLRNMKGGWAIPIGILIVLSFPPLFGHELVDIMVGVVWGIWKGFLICAAGHLLGEIANWFVFKYCCSGRSKKYEREKLGYACLAKVVREGGFWAVLIIRYSAIPGHLTTVIFSVVGIKFWVYLLANILSLPKLLITVYVGVAADNNSNSKGSKIISIAVIVVGALITIVAARWTFKKMDAVRPEVVAERRAARAARKAGYEGEMPAAKPEQEWSGPAQIYSPPNYPPPSR
ncbi:hypothetical protein DL93DRAFT_1876961 [Clavulina sp. PMI_390]|nr:hypothetical protein DL93DRAFT_1876961 [Clavulina sp. PMI_390]